MFMPIAPSLLSGAIGLASRGRSLRRPGNEDADMPLGDNPALGQLILGDAGRVGGDARARPTAVVTTPHTQLLGHGAGECGGVRPKSVSAELELGLRLLAEFP